jgi:hypothetical protein
MDLPLLVSALLVVEAKILLVVSFDRPCTVGRFYDDAIKSCKQSAIVLPRPWLAIRESIVFFP